MRSAGVNVILGILLVVALIGANAFFVAAEFSYVASRRARLEEAGEQGDPRAGRAVSVLQRLSFVLSGTQVGITATSLVLGFVAEPTIARALLPVLVAVGVPEEGRLATALVVALVLATGGQMVLGELAPKNLAIAQPEQWALRLARSTLLFTRVLGPVTALFDAASNRLISALGIEPVQELGAGVSPEELGIIVHRSGEEGMVTAGQADLLQRALAFRTLRAADAMVPRPRVMSISVDASCEDLRRLAVRSGHSRFPAVGEGLDDVKGVVQAKDVLRVDPAIRDRVPLRNILKPVLAVPETASLAVLLADMRRGRRQLAVVVDEYGGTAGVVTLEDIVEEIVGSIQDEYDVAEPAVRRLDDGSFVVPGSWRLDEVERETGFVLPEGEYETLGGLVMERLGRLPEPGDEVVLDRATLTVEDVQGHAVGRVRLVPLPDDSREDES